jgi:hypothetical protein
MFGLRQISCLPQVSEIFLSFIFFPNKGDSPSQVLPVPINLRASSVWRQAFWLDTDPNGGSNICGKKKWKKVHGIFGPYNITLPGPMQCEKKKKNESI